MQLEVGKIVEGKVTGITKFGAFVELEPGTVGMVHISEVASTYVNDISEHLTEGQQVTVKVLAVSEEGKISLSIKKAMKPTPRKDAPAREFQRSGAGNGQNREFNRNNRNGNYSKPNHNFNRSNSSFSKSPANAKPSSFEDMLSKFMQSSDEKISGMKKAREVNRRSGQRRSK
jgi:S1 RNA binding domain protein